jgi:hypothetical protein
MMMLKIEVILVTPANNHTLFTDRLKCSLSLFLAHNWLQEGASQRILHSFHEVKLHILPHESPNGGARANSSAQSFVVL